MGDGERGSVAVQSEKRQKVNISFMIDKTAVGKKRRGKWAIR